MYAPPVVPASRVIVLPLLEIVYTVFEYDSSERPTCHLNLGSSAYCGFMGVV